MWLENTPNQAPIATPKSRQHHLSRMICPGGQGLVIQMRMGFLCVLRAFAVNQALFIPAMTTPRISVRTVSKKICLATSRPGMGWTA